MISSFILLAVGISIFVYFARRKKQIQTYVLPDSTSQLLEENVAFYKELSDENKAIFRDRIKDFLANTTVRGVDVEIDDLDRLLVASGAIIPIFAFPGWKYNNITEVLIYKEAFNRDFGTTGPGRNVLGMVGDGAMHRQMILSRPSLRGSFSNEADGKNTVIHEFVHLIDKADGAVDGIPEYLLARPYMIPWIGIIRETIKEMKANDSRDINFYGATNDAEFFAVVSEYFFERPDKLKANHPELYALLDKMFAPQSTTVS